MAHITLLTTPMLEELAQRMPYFNDVWLDTRANWKKTFLTYQVLKRIHAKRWIQVYDLQSSQRTACYYHILKCWYGKDMPPWFGHKQSCFLPHSADEHAHLFKQIGFEFAPNFDWYKSSNKLVLPKKPYALIAAQASPHRPEKCWPFENYLEIITRLAQKNISSVLIGSSTDKELLRLPQNLPDRLLDLRGKTQLIDLIDFGRHAICAIGNDTGPMFLFAATRCPCWILFAKAPYVPKGSQVIPLYSPKFESLTPDTVWLSVCSKLPVEHSIPYQHSDLACNNFEN